MKSVRPSLLASSSASVVPPCYWARARARGSSAGARTSAARRSSSRCWGSSRAARTRSEQGLETYLYERLSHPLSTANGWSSRLNNHPIEGGGCSERGVIYTSAFRRRCDASSPSRFVGSCLRLRCRLPLPPAAAACRLPPAACLSPPAHPNSPRTPLPHTTSQPERPSPQGKASSHRTTATHPSL